MIVWQLRRYQIHMLHGDMILDYKKYSGEVWLS